MTVEIDIQNIICIVAGVFEMICILVVKGHNRVFEEMLISNSSFTRITISIVTSSL